MWTAVLTLLLLLASRAESATYLIGPTDSLPQAVARLQPGDTLYLRSGTYQQGINTGQARVPSGTAAAPIMIAAAPGAQVTLTGGITLSKGAGVSYLHVDRLHVDGSRQGTPVYLGEGNHHIRITNSEIHHAALHNVQGGAAHVEVRNSRIHSARFYGFYWSGNNSLFANNTVENNGGYAYQVYKSGGTTVTNNVIRGNTIRGNGLRCVRAGNQGCRGGIILASGTNNQAIQNVLSGNQSGIQINYGCRGCVAAGNTIVKNQAYGIHIGAGAQGTRVTQNQVGPHPVTIRDQGVQSTLTQNGTGPGAGGPGGAPPPAMPPPSVVPPGGTESRPPFATPPLSMLPPAPPRRPSAPP